VNRESFSRDESVLFHGDPYAGNLMAALGRVAILDWSLAGQLTTATAPHTSVPPT